MFGYLLGLDERLFLLVNGLVGKWPAFDRFMAFLVGDYFVPLSLSFLLLGLWFAGETAEVRARFQTMVLWSAAAIGLANAIIEVSNAVILRPRPFTYLPAHLLFYQPRDPSFPSNPAAIAFALAAGIWLCHRRIGLFALAVAALYAFSRLYAGVHFPSDVLAGAAVGSTCAYVAYRVFTAAKWIPGTVIWAMRKVRLA